MFRILIFSVVINIPIFAQIGGEQVFTFLNMPVSARQAALGGVTLTQLNDVNQPLWNPATITDNIDRNLSLNYVNYLADVNFFNASYAQNINRHTGTIHTGLTYLNYGKMIAADEQGLETGTFKAYDMALSVGYGYQIPRTSFYVGANLKLIQSKIEDFNAFGVASDVGILYQNERVPYSFALVVRNIGYQIKSYNDMREPLPLQVQAAMAYQLEHVPIKVYTTLDNLQKWQLAYTNPSDSTVDFENNIIEQKPTFFNNALRHLVLGAELFPDKGFNLRLGYNVQRANELRINETRTFAGLTFGFGLKVRKIKINYAFNKYHPATDSHTFNLNLDLY